MARRFGALGGRWALLISVGCVGLPACVFAERSPRTVEMVSDEMDFPQVEIDQAAKWLIRRTAEHFEEVKKHTPDELDRLPRHIDRATGSQRESDLGLRYDLHCILYFAAASALIPGSETLTNQILEFIRQSTDSHGGIVPGFDMGCAGPKVLELAGSRDVLRSPGSLSDHMKLLIGLRVQDGGWVNLDYSRAVRRTGEGYSVSSNEANPAAIMGLLKVGLPVGDKIIQGARAANDASILSSAYKGEYFPDYIVGDGLTLLMWKGVGVSSYEAFRKVNQELMEYLLTALDESHVYPASIALLGLQGYLPETSRPFRVGWKMVRDRYDPATHSFKAGRSSVFGSEFAQTACHTLEPYLAMKRAGYGNQTWRLPTPPPGPCKDVSAHVRSFWLAGKLVRVSAPAGSTLEVADSDFTVVTARELKADPSRDRVAMSRSSRFRFIVPCEGYYWVGPWFL
ncbi:MAG: hypothetical protein HYT87_11810 [Nitrospirae bacterium]|nr:hypothetical protein [Nitrospirota bacterium]